MKYLLIILLILFVPSNYKEIYQYQVEEIGVELDENDPEHAAVHISVLRHTPIANELTLDEFIRLFEFEEEAVAFCG